MIMILAGPIILNPAQVCRYMRELGEAPVAYLDVHYGLIWEASSGPVFTFVCLN